MARKFAVLISGSGTTLQYFIDRIEDGSLEGEICCVISSRPDAHGLERAQKHGIRTGVFVRKHYADTASFSAPIWEMIRSCGADLVTLAGFMCLLDIPPDFANKVMNTHPALIPSFCGKGMYGHHVHEAVIAHGVKVSGVTVHFADAQYDHGPIILQEAVSVLDGDTPDSIAARVQAREKEVYVNAIRLFLQDRLRIEGRQVKALPES
jgi:formyltetrahydrofolate-dependent phosphoribosylglycinamide formyltransferase